MKGVIIFFASIEICNLIDDYIEFLVSEVSDNG